MDLGELTHAEKLAFAGLARLLLRADSELTDEEAAALGDVAVAIGEDEFWKLVDEAAGTEDAEIRRLAKGVTRPEVRELIYGTLFELGQTGSIVAEESELLDWLADAWGLEISDVGDELPPDDDDDDDD
jgi:hypothetical protein